MMVASLFQPAWLDYNDIYTINNIATFYCITSVEQITSIDPNCSLVSARVNKAPQFGTGPQTKQFGPGCAGRVAHAINLLQPHTLYTSTPPLPLCSV